MKKYLLTVLAAMAAFFAAPAWSTVDVGVGITIRQPGVYGRIEIGAQPAPPLIYTQPIIVRQPAVVVQQAPLYLYVPPGHAKKWDKHCGRYNACGRPVYFVQEQWVQERYDDKYGKGWRKGKYRDDDSSSSKGKYRDDDSHSSGKGHGKGKKHDD